MCSPTEETSAALLRRLPVAAANAVANKEKTTSLSYERSLRSLDLDTLAFYAGDLSQRRSGDPCKGAKDGHGRLHAGQHPGDPDTFRCGENSRRRGHARMEATSTLKNQLL